MKLSQHFCNYWKNWRQVSNWYVFLIFTNHINPACATYVLKIRQRHSHRIHVFIFPFKISRDSESFISYGIMPHTFGAKKETVSVPYLIEFTLRLVRTLFPRKPLLLYLSTKISFIRGEESSCKNLYACNVSMLYCDRLILLKQFWRRWWLAIICNSQWLLVYSIYFIIKASAIEHPN